MFRWDGLHDGMERNINSRQTDDIDTGAEGYRPTLNSYLFGDAKAIAQASAVFGDTATAREYSARADSLRQRVEEELWDERRTFFLHQFAHDEKDGVRALTRTYDSGRYAGDAHGRELIGYVPWQFDLPEPGKGYERAWRFLMDTSYFLAPYGPTTTERHDPQFTISPRCCWWSGNSWPYATTQTLVAMANLLDHYRQDAVSARDWMTLFSSYTRTQRKDGRPYVAEAANPDNSSWEGHDTPWHSEHYFHSGYVNLVITGVAGLRPRADDSVEVNPLAPREWRYFALDDVRYHGRRLAVLWDREGTRYGRGRGLILLADGRVIGRAAELGRLVAYLGPPRIAAPAAREVNFAVNNGRGAYPWVEASYAAPENPPTYLVDGNYWYHTAPANRWTNIGTPNTQDTATLEFGVERRIQRVALYVLDDGPAGAVRAPARYDVEIWRNGRWVTDRSIPGVKVLLQGSWVRVPSQRRKPALPEGHRANVVSFPPVSTSRIRVILVPKNGAPVGLSELEAWGPETLPLAVAAPAPRDLAYNPGNGGYPRASASFTSEYDRIEQVNDLRIAFTRYSRNRWTAWQSPNPRDWVAIDFGSSKTVHAVELFLYGDGGGIKAPRDFSVEIWRDGAWQAARVRSRVPERPLASARNVVTIEPVETPRVRVLLEHDLPAFSGITELIVR